MKGIKFSWHTHAKHPIFLFGLSLNQEFILLRLCNLVWSARLHYNSKHNCHIINIWTTQGFYYNRLFLMRTPNYSHKKLENKHKILLEKFDLYTLYWVYENCVKCNKLCVFNLYKSMGKQTILTVDLEIKKGKNSFRTMFLQRLLIKSKESNLGRFASH